MKRLLFIIPAFNHGGTNRCLLHILSCIDNNEFTIDIFVISPIGPYKEIFSRYNILQRDLLLSSIFESYEHIKQEVFWEKIMKIFSKSLYRVFSSFLGKQVLQCAFRNAAKRIDKMNYDTVVAMQEGTATHFVAHTSAANKVAWVHCDYSKYFEIVNADEEKIYTKFNHIICVSEYTKWVFIKHYPSLKNKCHGIHNMIDYKSIIEMSNDNSAIDDRFKTDNFCIVSIGRLSGVKQFHIIPQIAELLIADGCKFRWYIIGDGEEKEHIQSMICKHHVSDIVVLLGEMDNPYPYIKSSDLIVCTSSSEACPNVINEAKILHVPIITTDFGSAPEFIKNGYNGVITNRENIKNSIEEMILNREKYARIKNYISLFAYSNDQIIDCISKLL